jgi:hypothetical protein
MFCKTSQSHLYQKSSQLPIPATMPSEEKVPAYSPLHSFLCHIFLSYIHLLTTAKAQSTPRNTGPMPPKR